MILDAIQFASKKHKGQVRRGSGLPYVMHPIMVMELVQQWKGNSKHIMELKCAALLHDTLEDTDTSYHEIEDKFGPLVASIVMELTSSEEGIKKLGKHEYLYQKMQKMSQYAFTLKLLDRLSNVIDLPSEKYKTRTIKMLNKLMVTRIELTECQEKIIEKIIDYCED